MNVKPIAVQSTLALANALRSGDLPVEAYLNRLEVRYNEREPLVHSMLPEDGRFDRLRKEGQELVNKFPDPVNRPPLFAIPVGVKDIFHVKGFKTRAGSRLPASVLKGREARSVTLLKEDGALIFGKTVTTEFAYFGPGPTRNLYNLEHTPGGSSSGSAVAVAAELCPLTFGTQTIGSITRPASYLGVVGFKPSYDRISRSGVIPLSPSLDHVGVFAADVAGVDVAASLLCPDWHLVVADSLPVLGIPTGPYLENASTSGLAHFWATCEHLAKAGCVVKEVAIMPDFQAIVDRHNLIVAAEAAQVHAQWYAEYGERYHSKTKDLIVRGREVSIGQLAEALTGRKKLRIELTEMMESEGIDLWISPSAVGPAPKGLDSTGDPIMNLPWTHSGLPTVNLPSGMTEDGLPMGLQVAGRWYEDEKLLEWAAVLEPIVRSVN